MKKMCIRDRSVSEHEWHDNYVGDDRWQGVYKLLLSKEVSAECAEQCLSLIHISNEVFYIGGTEVLPPPLETDEEKCCLIALVDKNVAMSKEQAKKQLIEHNLRLVVDVYKRQGMAASGDCGNRRSIPDYDGTLCDRLGRIVWKRTWIELTEAWQCAGVTK